MRRPSYSMRLVLPVLAVLREQPGFPARVLESLEQLDVDERIDIARAHRLMESSVEWLGNPDLGLLAGQRMQHGDTGALDFALGTAETLREALRTAVRYLALINNGVEVSLDEVSDRAALQFHSLVPMTRAANDFMLCAFFRGHPGVWDSVQELEVWFAHPQPADVSKYAEAFPGAQVRFDAPWTGFRFEAAALDRAMPGADPRLHSLVRKHADRLLAELPQARSLTDEVRRVLTRELCHGKPDVEQVAHALHMSARTLGRRLQDEGTSFRELRDGLRRQLALSYVANPEVGLGEVAFLLGFSDVAVFHRAFRRWTGRTPLQHRREMHERE